MRSLLASAAIILGTAACTSSAEEECLVGSEACACTAGGACDAGLECRSELCVDPSGGGGGGAAGAGIATIEILLVTTDCTGAQAFSLTADASGLEISVTGPDMDPVEITAAGSAATVELGNIPLGTGRMVAVRALKVGELVAFGRSAPFEVKASNTPTVLVALRAVNRFSPAADLQNGCTKMVYPRAGHSAALLPDGRILLAGGFRELDPNGRGLGYLSSSEIFDPVTGTFTEGPDMCGENHVCIPRAFAPAVTMPDGRVMLAGGESQLDEATERQALGSAGIYDPGQGRWTLDVPMRAARRFSTATLVSRGHVVVAGGLDSQGNVLLSSEFYDPVSGSFRDGATLTARAPATAGGRAYHSAAAVGSQAVALLGGIDADKQPTGQVVFLQWSPSNGTYDLSAQTEDLTAPIFGAGVAVLGGLYTMIGGSQQYNDPGYPFSGVFGSAQFTALPSPTPDEQGYTEMQFPRAFPCVAPVADDGALVVGGFDQGGRAIDGAELLTYEAGDVNAGFAGGQSATGSKMVQKRAYATCTRFGGPGEQQILITGGIGADGRATDAAEIYAIKWTPP